MHACTTSVINSDWHMQRTMDVFSHVFSLPPSSPSPPLLPPPSCRPHTRAPQLTFIRCASGLDADVETERLARETVVIPKFAPSSRWQKETPSLEVPKPETKHLKT